MSSAAPEGGVVVVLSSNSASAIVPASVTVPSGSATANFLIQTQNVATLSLATVTAAYNGTVTTAVLTITPTVTVDLSSVTVSAATVTGGTSATGTVTLSAPAPEGGVLIDLWTNGSPAFVPANVTIPAGSTSANFNVSTVAVSNTSQGTITAFYKGISKTATITVTPPAVAVSLASVSVDPTSVKGGVSATGTVRLSAPAPQGGMVVDLWTNGSPAFVPVSVTVAAGATTGTFNVSTISVSGTQQGTITAFYLGTSKTAVITVNP